MTFSCLRVEKKEHTSNTCFTESLLSQADCQIRMIIVQVVGSRYLIE